jgi:hypothetical protein
MIPHDDDDIVDFSFLLILLELLSEECNEVELELLQLLDEMAKKEGSGSWWDRSKPRKFSRTSWQNLTESLNDNTFRRLFRMSRETFDILCSKIKEKVTEEVFKSADWITAWKCSQGSSLRAPIGGFIPGEMKIAMMIRILSGASYLDLLMGYSVASCTVFKCFLQQDEQEEKQYQQEEYQKDE